MMQPSSDPLLHRLERALETGASRQEITEALAAAEQLGDGLPPLLAYRAREHIENEKFLGRRRLLFGVALSVFLFLCPISAIGLTTVTRLREFQRDGSVFQQLIDRQQWDEAQAFLDSLDSATRSRPPFVRGRALVRKELDERKSRRAEFAELVRQIRSDPSATIDDAVVSRLDELAGTEQERSIAAEIAAKADEQQLRREANRIDDQTRQFERLQKAVDDFFENPPESMGSPARTAQTRHLRRQLQQFVSANHLANPELAAAAKQTAELLDREERRARLQAERQTTMDEVTQSVGDADLFLQNAGKFALSFPNDPMAGPLQQFVKNRTLIDGTAAWIEVLQHAAFTAPETADPEQSQVWMEKLEHARSLQREHPIAEQAMRWRPHYATIANRRQAMQRLRELFQSDLLRPMYVYPDSLQRKYFSDMPPQRQSQTAHVVEYFSDLSLNRKTKNFGSRYHQQILPRVHLAGHCEYAAKAAATVQAMQPSEFTPTVYRLLADLQALEIDPIFRLDLVRRLLRIGIDGSEPLRIGFGDYLASLETSDFTWDANWISPDDADPRVAEARDQAKSLQLLAADDWQRRVAKMGEAFRRFRQPRPSAPQWVGWVASDQGDFIALFPSERPPGKLFVLVPQGSGDRPVLVELHSREGDSEVLIDDPDAQVVGAPVCVSIQHSLPVDGTSNPS